MQAVSFDVLIELKHLNQLDEDQEVVGCSIVVPIVEDDLSYREDKTADICPKI